MRVIAAVIGFLVVLSTAAWAEDAPCRWYTTGAGFVEWVENGEPHGARLVTRDPRWHTGILSLEGAQFADCQTCSKGEIVGAALWFDAGASRLVDVSPETVAGLLRMAPFGILGEFSARSDAVPTQMGELAGRARVIRNRMPDGRLHDVIALSVGKGCVSLFGILYERNDTETSTDRLATFAQAIDVEWYKPAFDTDALKPMPPIQWEGFPLGDAFRRRYLEKP